MKCKTCNTKLNIFGSKKLRLCSTHYLRYKKNIRVAQRNKLEEYTKELKLLLEISEQRRNEIIFEIQTKIDRIADMKTLAKPQEMKDARSKISREYNIVDNLVGLLLREESVMLRLGKKIKD
jgi:hypothetical protein